MKHPIKKTSTRLLPQSSAGNYQKIVYWSDEDACFVGQCPALFFGGVHGDDEAKVYADLCQAVEEHLAILKNDKKTPPPSDLQKYSGKLTLRIDPALHRVLALRATTTGTTLTGHIERTLAQSVGA
jgi:predicted HicB family RNase H-like nuclease